MSVTKRAFGLIILSTALQAMFINCSKIGTDVDQNGSLSRNRSIANINSFSMDPPALNGKSGFNFLMKEYLGPNCGSCHEQKLSFGGAFFDSKDIDGSYEISKYGLKKPDMIMRITKNPFCPTCKLDPQGEVYQAILYWLDHRE